MQLLRASDPWLKVWLIYFDSLVSLVFAEILLWQHDLLEARKTRLFALVREQYSSSTWEMPLEMKRSSRLVAASSP